MRLFTETIKMFGMMTGFLSCFILYYLVFVAIGEVAGHTWIGNFLYGVTTLFILSYITAKDKLGAEL